MAYRQGSTLWSPRVHHLQLPTCPCDPSPLATPSSSVKWVQQQCLPGLLSGFIRAAGSTRVRPALGGLAQCCRFDF